MNKMLIPILLTTVFQHNEIASNQEKFFINNYGVEMTESNYKKLLSIGYTERELDYISQIEYDNKISLKVCSVKEEKYIIKTSCKIVNDEIISTDEHIFDEDSALFDLAQITNNSKVSKNSTQVGYICDEYKEMHLFGVLTMNENDEYNFLVKINFDWLTTPNHLQRGNDYIAIKIADNVNILSEVINGNSYPNFESTFMYTKDLNYYEYNYINEPVQNIGISNIIRRIRGDDIGQYTYSMGEGLIVKHHLPSDVHESVNEIGYLKIHEEVYSDFFLTLSANFTPVHSNITSTSFNGIYAHNKLNMPVITGIEATFISEAPYLEVGSILDDYDVLNTVILYNESDLIWPSC